ncbi:MAG: TIGR01777 family protein [Planctomycetes bacterium]|nr:TIGR01777 family protein [Planctomycetota bacterium]
MNDKSVVIAGGSGFLGISLAYHLLESNFKVTLLSRNRPKANGEWEFVKWDARTLGDWQSVIEGAAAVVNLVGRSVDCVKTPDHCDEILRSRIEGTRVLGEAMRSVATPPPVWVQMSTAHIYGDPPSLVCTENSPFGYGLAPQVGNAWESQFAQSVLSEQRGVVLRTSFVVGTDRGSGGGALSRLRFVTRLGLGGKIGSGRQGMSWIHEKDMNRIFERAILDSSMQGAYIASSPNPVSQMDFMRSLRRTLRVPIGLPATEAMVRFGARWLLGTDPELALYGRYVVPQRLIESGFSFEFPDLDRALDDLR